MNKIMAPSENQWKIMTFCPDCGAVTECAVWGHESHVTALNKKKASYMELYCQCPYCGNYPHSPILYSENEKRKRETLASIEQDEPLQ